MKYNFTSVMDRRGKDALAVDGLGTDIAPNKPKDGFDIIPMWVADMNFPTVPTVCKAIAERASHPAFGYFYPKEEYYTSIIKWHKIRNGVDDLTPENIGYENGVLGGLLSAIGTFCSKGDNVLVLSPLYVGFRNSLSNAGYNIVSSRLETDENGIWRMNYDDMEEKILSNHIHATVFCSPHNPTGRVWERWEIEKAMELFKKYDVYVVSDEIWSDIIMPGYKHIPTQSVSEDAKNRTVALYAPSKTFNLAGLIGAYHIIYNERIRHRVEKESSLSHYNNMNVLSMHALIGAYSDEGYEWVDELCQTISQNVDYACDYIKTHFKGVTVAKAQGTYMLFLDCSEWLKEHGLSVEELVKKGADVGVAWQDGTHHGGIDQIRLNLALPLSRVKEAFSRLDKYVFNEE
ncbi:MAG: aminotransferase class I/II-fold pyridoxal phosphate-dependent enzyme [Ruminococcaceae bacterium]|nr:aminotransferase class I/II-fold pyridoxal phosphate-dependent enzyme [Oscillospiraceae bacterium]